MLRLLHEPEISDPVQFLDGIASRMEQQVDVETAMETLHDGLWWIRKSLPSDHWREFLHIAQGHRLRQLVHSDPFTRRSFTKPRGYPGDAPLLDLIYHDIGFADLAGTDDLGTKIFSFTANAPTAAAVRERRDYVARAIDEVCEERSNASIMSVACGHLREATVAKAVRSHSFGRFMAIDQDAHSIAEVQRCYGDFGIEAAPVRLRTLFADELPSHGFDLIYAAGLYDYLEDAFAQRLTARLFWLLKPGGRLIIGNFVPWVHGVGYMEAYMDWSLIYRDAGDMTSLSRGIPESEISLKRTFTLSNPDIIYLQLGKRLTTTALRMEPRVLSARDLRRSTNCL